MQKQTKWKCRSGLFVETSTRKSGLWPQQVSECNINEYVSLVRFAEQENASGILTHNVEMEINHEHYSMIFRTYRHVCSVCVLHVLLLSSARFVLVSVGFQPLCERRCLCGCQPIYQHANKMFNARKPQQTFNVVRSTSAHGCFGCSFFNVHFMYLRSCVWHVDV